MEATLTKADGSPFETGVQSKQIALCRINAELTGRSEHLQDGWVSFQEYLIQSARACLDQSSRRLVRIIVDCRRHLTSGMQVTADNTPHRCLLRRRLTCGSKLNAKRGRSHIHLGTRTILEYLLSPMMVAFHEARRER